MKKENQPALSYLEERGFNEKTIRKFQLGFAPSEGKAFTELALKNEYKLEYLEKSGLTIVNEGRQYDRFRGRVIFPIHNLTGRVIAFGARIIVLIRKPLNILIHRKRIFITRVKSFTEFLLLKKRSLKKMNVISLKVIQM